MQAAKGGAFDETRAEDDAYSTAFYRVRAESQFNTFSAETQEAVEAAINDGAEPAEIQALVMERIGGFSADVMDTVPTATARLETAQRIGEMGRGLETTVNPASASGPNKSSFRLPKGTSAPPSGATSLWTLRATSRPSGLAICQRPTQRRRP